MVSIRIGAYLKTSNVTEEACFAGPQIWIPVVPGRLKDLAFDQCSLSCLIFDRFLQGT